MISSQANASRKHLLTQHNIIIALAISFFMILTRGSHLLTSFALPDASLAVLFLGGLYLRKLFWFTFFVVLATVIDFSAASIDSAQAFCLTNGYIGMLPTYAVMWIAGIWVINQKNNLIPLNYLCAGVLATFLSFVISTQTYYLFSGRFPNSGLMETINYGWEYLPGYMEYTAIYLCAFLFSAKLFTKFKSVSLVSNNLNFD